MHKRVSLIRDIFIPQELRCELNASEKYIYFKKMYDAGANYILLNNVDVFGPFPRATVAWDISEAQKIATYNPEVTKVLNWIKTKIIINLGLMDYKTLDVLIRIATGMLNNCNIPKQYQMLFHDNMVRNLHKEHNEIVVSDLPFLGRKRKEIRILTTLNVVRRISIHVLFVRYESTAPQRWGTWADYKVTLVRSQYPPLIRLVSVISHSRLITTRLCTLV